MHSKLRKDIRTQWLVWEISNSAKSVGGPLVKQMLHLRIDSTNGGPNIAIKGQDCRSISIPLERVVKKEEQNSWLLRAWVKHVTDQRETLHIVSFVSEGKWIVFCNEFCATLWSDLNLTEHRKMLTRRSASSDQSYVRSSSLLQSVFSLLMGEVFRGEHNIIIWDVPISAGVTGSLLIAC